MKTFAYDNYLDRVPSYAWKGAQSNFLLTVYSVTQSQKALFLIITNLVLGTLWGLFSSIPLPNRMQSCMRCNAKTRLYEVRNQCVTLRSLIEIVLIVGSKTLAFGSIALIFSIKKRHIIALTTLLSFYLFIKNNKNYIN